MAIRTLLHPPQSICNGIIYCGRGDGELGFPRLEHLVPRVALKLGLRFQSLSDPAVVAVSGCASTTAHLHRIAHSVRIAHLCTERYLRQLKDLNSKTELLTWKNLVSQGKAVPALTGDRVENAFMYDPSLLKPCRFITSMQLRTNTAGNRMSLNRAIPQTDMRCR